MLGPQDVVTVTVLGEPDLSRKYTIEQDGTFTFPLIGRVTGARADAARSRSRSSRRSCRRRLSQEPAGVSVAVEAYRSQRILIMGEVLQPGEYQLTGDMTLLSALAKAGSVTADGRARRDDRSGGAEARRVRTATAAEPEIIRIDLDDLQAGNMALNIPLHDGDTINVPKAQSVFVSGQVKTPGGYAGRPGMTVLQVLSLAGGLTDRGSDSRIKIRRTVDGKQKEIKSQAHRHRSSPATRSSSDERIF